ncbi:MAG: bifunctional demethylmenaquinone methyltransferase/2-methoxy-6-polyprenyl-1,4-benzoquinol methylase UbiE [bacterium]|nr:bifunctional demethylmenaquinone methyltransferase/2-methoxy-6-polyprenyl-1,4-benzoquinol methylase UbiE [bacterium]
MPAEDSRDPGRIRSMFGSIAHRYDLLNHLLSLNLDRRWRRKAVSTLSEGKPHRVLDLCGGTGDLSVELARRTPADLVVCCDFTRGMLELAGPKFQRLGLQQRCITLEADGLRLPFPDASFEAVTVGFGVRNFADLDTGLREMHRVLRPGGQLIVLEFSTPTAPVLSGLYRFYLKRVLPRFGDGVSGRSGPYGYLARTIGRFPDGPEFAGKIREAGFAACDWTGLTGGIVAVHKAKK